MGLLPTRSYPPTPSRGRLYSEEEFETLSKDLEGLTLTPTGERSYTILKNACWTYETEKIKSWSLMEVMDGFMPLLAGKADRIPMLCGQFGLAAGLIIRLYGTATAMPEFELSNSTLLFWASAGVNITVDFCLD